MVDVHGCIYISNPTTILGIGETLNEAAQIKVYPNPSLTGEWQVEVNDALIGSNCEVFDARGRIVYRARLERSTSTVSIHVLSGIYLMKISSSGGAYNVKLVEF